MVIEALENAPTFAETWRDKNPPYELPNGELLTEETGTCRYFTLKGQEHSIENDIPNIITLLRKPTQEVFAGYELFFIFEKCSLFKWQFRTIDIDGEEEIHMVGRYSQVRDYTQEYLERYAGFHNDTEDQPIEEEL